MIDWICLQRLVFPACLIMMQMLPLMQAAGQEVRRENIRSAAGRDLARRQLVPSPPEAALARARASMNAQDFARAHEEYRIAVNSVRDGAGMERLRAEAVRGFAESGVKLARQRMAEGRPQEAEQIAREILSERYDPNYRPAVELLAALRVNAGEDHALSANGRHKRSGEARQPPAIQPLASPSLTRDREIETSGFTETPPSGGAARERPRATAGEGERRVTAAPPEPIYDGQSVTMAAPPPPPSPSATVAPAAKKPIVKIYFATDRLPSGDHGPSKYFGKEWNKGGEQLITGFVNVSIPPVHQEGKVERPWKIFTFELKENAKKHFVLTELHVSKSDDFYANLRDEFDRRSLEDRSTFVFIHGFNVTFDEAAYSAAQMAYDLDFKGVPMMFSWPSQGRLLGYDGDEETIEFSSPNLQAFLQRVARESGALRINLIAHSMGNRLLTKALKELAPQSDIQPLFANVIMAAPDVNATLFERMWPQIKNAAKRFTLYASSDDQALITSQRAKGDNNFRRLGEGGPNIVVLPDLDTVDASGIDTSLLGHSYVDSCKPVMEDWGLLIEKEFAPSKRKLHERHKEDLAYWAFQ